MNYETPEEKIKRLEKQVADLRKAGRTFAGLFEAQHKQIITNTKAVCTFIAAIGGLSPNHKPVADMEAELKKAEKLVEQIREISPLLDDPPPSNPLG